MTTTVNLRKLLHRKAWEMCTPNPVVTWGQGSILAFDENAILPVSENATYMFSGGGLGALYNYNAEQDSWLQVISGGPTPVNSAGSMSVLHPLGMWGGTKTQTALAGTTTTLITSRNLVRKLAGLKIRVTGGTGAGYEGTISDNTVGPNSVLTVTPASGIAFSATTTFEVYSGTVWLMPSVASTTGTIYYFDRATNAWGTKATVTLAANLANHGKFVITPSLEATFDSGTATAGAGNGALISGTKNWLTNCWTNYQVRIISGTGAGQYRTISSNTATTLIVSAIWTTSPDATSTFEITGDDDKIYLIGNAGVNIYQYSLSANTWTAAMTVNVARAAVTGAGVTANWIANVSGWTVPQTAAVRANSTPYVLGQIITPVGGTDVNASWYECTTAGTTAVAEVAVALWRVNIGAAVTDGTAVFTRRMVPQNGRYIYSFRGAASAALDILDLAAMSWNQCTSGTNFAYGHAGAETFSTGTSATDGNGAIYIYKAGDAQKLLKFDVATHTLLPLALGTYSGSTVYDGQKLWSQFYKDGATTIRFFYIGVPSKYEVLRMMEI